MIGAGEMMQFRWFDMRARLGFGRCGAGILCAVAVAAFSPAGAQNPRNAPASPLGAAPWSTNVKPESPVDGIALEPQQLETVKKVSGYFNGLINLRGTFVQTAADNKRMRGRFFVKRPGKLRFEYNLPSRQLIVSDGSMLAIQDLDMHTDDRVALDQTPFRLLLRDDVDLLRDAKILEVQEAEDLIILALQDKSPDAPGQIRLFLSKGPGLELKEWVTTDSQGTDTRVEVANLDKPAELDAELFRVISPALRKIK
jgi:outer membrane lipoprotein-sorting protein